ncbi:hypothetical protein ILYODFUR_002758 [Ilyodon furcidens]|uniref:Uncharacterized protein n=1 Tax=Ilyodon furcidens TaxID=33524 RepID=A0ABV0T4R2_9TELE
MGAGTGLNDRRPGGGRDGSWVMGRQRGSLLCVAEAHKGDFSVWRDRRAGRSSTVLVLAASDQAVHRNISFFSRVFSPSPSSGAQSIHAALGVEMQPRLALIMS